MPIPTDFLLTRFQFIIYIKLYTTNDKGLNRIASIQTFILNIVKSIIRLMLQLFQQQGQQTHNVCLLL